MHLRNKSSLITLFLAISLLAAGCSVNISQQSYATPNTAPGGNIASMPTLVTGGGFSILHLTGKLIFAVNASSTTTNFMNILELDLVTGGVKTLFQSDPSGYIDSVVVSPDHKTLVMAYSPPSLQQGAYFLPLTLYSMPTDGSQPPQQLLALPVNDDQYFEPAWAPDGKYLYFVLANYGLPPEDANQHFPVDQIFRAAYPDGQPEKLLEKAYWPRLSPDGSRLIYVSENIDDGTNKLYIANSDGTNPQQIILSGANVPTIIDAPVILPDGKTILFSAPTPVQPAAFSWLDRVFGVIPVSAHNIPSEWWSVPISGGAITQLTNIQAASLYASPSPDNQHIASFSGDGVFVMNPDGTNLNLVYIDTGGNMGTVNWIP